MGSEMCIRDRRSVPAQQAGRQQQVRLARQMVMWIVPFAFIPYYYIVRRAVCQLKTDQKGRVFHRPSFWQKEEKQIWENIIKFSANLGGICGNPTVDFRALKFYNHTIENHSRPGRRKGDTHGTSHDAARYAPQRHGGKPCRSLLLRRQLQLLGLLLVRLFYQAIPSTG